MEKPLNPVPLLASSDNNSGSLPVEIIPSLTAAPSLGDQPCIRQQGEAGR